MKNTTITLLLCFAINFIFGQGIISDIMAVETVSLELTEVHEKLITKYKTTLAEEKSGMENDLSVLDKKYQNDVTKFVEDYTQKLKEGEEKIVSRVKQITVSRVNSLTMTHRTVKKNRVQDFFNKMQLAVRSLPDFLRTDADAEVQSIGDAHLETLNDDYIAHLETVKAFEEQVHLIITEGAYEPLN